MLFVPEVLNAPVNMSAYDATTAMIKNQEGNPSYIASGAFGTVYGAKGSDIVYKVGDCRNNDGYLSFLKTVAFHGSKDNPFLPKIFGIRFIMDRESKNDSRFVVALERLKDAGSKLNSYSSVYDPEQRELYNLLKYAAGEQQTFDYSDKEFNKTLSKQSAKNREYILEVGKLIKMAKGENCIDMHNGNVMFRGNQMVVTDPIA